MTSTAKSFSSYPLITAADFSFDQAKLIGLKIEGLEDCLDNVELPIREENI